MKVDLKNSGNEIGEDLERSAAHEAAHAFIVWWDGGVIHRVSITGPARSSESSPNFCEYASLDFLQVQNVILRDAKVAIAPAVNEELVGKELSFGCMNDVREFMQSLIWTDAKIQEMIKDTKRLLKSLQTDWEKPTLEFFKNYKLEVQKIIAQPTAQKAIERLTKKLLKQGRLNGYEVASVFEEVYDSRPKQVQPARYHSKPNRIENLPNALQFLGELVTIGLNALRGYREQNEQEQEITEKIAIKILALIFQIDETFSKL